MNAYAENEFEKNMNRIYCIQYNTFVEYISIYT